MGVFDDLERKLEGVVNGAFARAFKGDVQPVEITARLQRELDSEAHLLSRDRKLVPNDFTVGLSSHDYDRLTPYSRTLNAEIIPQLREYAANAGYLFNGPVTIAYELDASLPVGRFTVVSQAVAAAATPATTTAIRRASLVLEVNGIRHPLSPPDSPSAAARTPTCASTIPVCPGCTLASASTTTAATPASPSRTWAPRTASSSTAAASRPPRCATAPGWSSGARACSSGLR